MHGQDGPVPFAGAPLVPPFAIFDEGHTGVAIFMTLSGYLFAKLLDGKDIVYSRFYLNRALRLFPMLIVMMGLKALEMAIFDYGDFARLGQNIVRGFVMPTWPNGGWSVAAELHFYILLPFILFLGRRSSNLILALLGLAILLRVGVYVAQGTVHWLAYWTIVGRIDQFLLGIFFFMKRDWFVNRIPLVLGIFAVFYVIFWAFNAAGGFYNLGGSEPSPSSFWIILPTLEAVAYGTAIACYNQNLRSNGGRISKIWAEYGKFSYSIYLLHFFVVFRAAKFIDERVISLDNFYVALPFGILVFLGMYPLGWLSYRFIEEPFLRFRKRYTVPRTAQEVPAQ